MGHTQRRTAQRNASDTVLETECEHLNSQRSRDCCSTGTPQGAEVTEGSDRGVFKEAGVFPTEAGQNECYQFQHSQS